MSNPTTPFGWQMPTATDLVTDLPADFEVFGQAVATSMGDLLGGTTGQVLSKTSNTDMDFTWVAPTTGDITGVTAGTGISGGGTSGDVTVTNSMATALTTKGDLTPATGSAAFARLGVGANDTVLIADSTAATGMKWGTPASGGMTLISETTASALSSLSLSSIPQTYKQLMLVWCGIYHGAASNAFSLRINNNSGTAYFMKASTITGASLTSEFRATTDINASATTTIDAFGNNITSTGDLIVQSNGYLLIDNYASTTKLKTYAYQFGYFGGGSNKGQNGIGVYNSTTAITSLDVYRRSGASTFSNDTNTSIRLYGIS
jgi:hypothetical protein